MKHRAGHTDKTGGLPDATTTASKQKYNNGAQGQGKNPIKRKGKK
jgi:hypothetical protein